MPAKWQESRPIWPDLVLALDGGAERTRGELLKLGIRVAKRTIQRHMMKVRPPDLGLSIPKGVTIAAPT
jgi:hypothetical protein